jgi:hypothetical protein
MGCSESQSVKAGPETLKRQIEKSLVAIGILIPVVSLHFITGHAYKGPFPGFVNGYLLYILLPFAVYFLLCPHDALLPFLRPWYVKSLPVFAIGLSAEVAQYHGVPIFGETYDPLGFFMYGIGVLAAAVIDTQVFARSFAFWNPEAKGQA